MMIQIPIKYRIDGVLHQMNQAECGAHHLIVYPDQRALSELYTRYVKTELERENKIVLILPHYETVENLKKHLLDNGFPASDRDMKNMNIRLW
jgi:hypothetical protein